MTSIIEIIDLNYRDQYRDHHVGSKRQICRFLLHYLIFL